MVPAAFGVPSVHVCVPVAHEVAPLRQAGLGLVVQLPLDAHATHVPATLQTWSMPHAVPGALSASSTQTGAPVEHSTTPRRQVLPALVVHMAPAVHATQVPVAVQTWLVPHDAPAAAFMPSTQPGVAPQVVRPRLQGALGFPEQLVPSAHVMQLPAPVQTRPRPQGLPATRSRAVSTHPAIAPHVVSPSLQGSGLVVHDVPAVHVTQEPPRQTRSVDAGCRSVLTEGHSSPAWRARVARARLVVLTA